MLRGTIIHLELALVLVPTLIKRNSLKTSGKQAVSFLHRVTIGTTTTEIHKIRLKLVKRVPLNIVRSLRTASPHGKHSPTTKI